MASRTNLASFASLYVAQGLALVKTPRYRTTFLARLVLMSTDNNSNSSDVAVGAQTAPAEIDSDQVHDAVGQLQTSLSRFLQEDQRAGEDLSRLMEQPGDQIWRIERKIEDVRKATERNLES